MLVVPAIIPQTKEQLETEIKKVSSFAKLVQIDISDGLFTSVKTWPYNDQDEVFLPKWQNIQFEIHLMVQSPEEIVLDWINAGASAIVAHIEAENFQKVIDICREHNVSVGIAIKPSTNMSRLKPFVSQVHFIQVMGNDSLGKHGVPLDQKAVDQIKALQKLYPERIIAIDIGVTEDTEGLLVSAGADKLVSGGAILNAENPEEVFKSLESMK